MTNAANKLNLIRQAGREGILEAHVTAMSHASSFSSLSMRTKLLSLVGTLAFLNAYFAAFAFAASCGGDAGTKLAQFINSGAQFLIYIGGAAALLMFAIGGIMIMVGGSHERVSKGMKIVKNAMIGLVVLAAGFFFKFVVLNLVQGATDGAGVKGGSSNCIDADGVKGLN